MSSKFHFNHSKGKIFLLSLETRGIKLGLSRTKKLLQSCKNPQKSINSVQIIGTNGKGSTAASMSAILKHAGYKVGLYTSPHLVNVNERIQINNQSIPDEYIDFFIEKYKNEIIDLSCTFFESLTVLALHYFFDNDVDIAILETGLGGKYDSVTACNPNLQLFTSISKDHMHILGNNIEDIAKNKAYAIQKGVPCISVKQTRVVRNILDKFADKQKTKIDYQIKLDNRDFSSPLMGEHQFENLSLAIKACKQLYKINYETLLAGSKKIFWPGRIQTIQKNPNVIFDVSHNEESILAFCEFFKSLSSTENKTLIISLQKTKNIKNTVSKLSSLFNRIIVTQLNQQMYTTRELRSIFSSVNHVTELSYSSKNIHEIVINSKKNDFIAIIGSHYWGEEIEKIFKISLVTYIDK